MASGFSHSRYLTGFHPLSPSKLDRIPYVCKDVILIVSIMPAAHFARFVWQRVGVGDRRWADLQGCGIWLISS
jgi:hypothetical protein